MDRKKRLWAELASIVASLQNKILCIIGDFITYVMNQKDQIVIIGGVILIVLTNLSIIQIFWT